MAHILHSGCYFCGLRAESRVRCRHPSGHCRAAASAMTGIPHVILRPSARRKEHFKPLPDTVPRVLVAKFAVSFCCGAATHCINTPSAGHIHRLKYFLPIWKQSIRNDLANRLHHIPVWTGWTHGALGYQIPATWIVITLPIVPIPATCLHFDENCNLPL